MTDKAQEKKLPKDLPSVRSKSDKKDTVGRKGKALKTVAEPNGNNKASKSSPTSVAKKHALEPPLVVEGIRHSVKIKGSGKSAAKASDTTKAGSKKATTSPAQLDKRKQQTAKVNTASAAAHNGRALLAQAAMQQSVALPGAPLALPLVTPPTLPQESTSPPPPPPPPSSTSPPQKRRGIPHTYTDYSNEPDSPSFVRKKTGEYKDALKHFLITRMYCMQTLVSSLSELTRSYVSLLLYITRWRHQALSGKAA